MGLDSQVATQVNLQKPEKNNELLRNVNNATDAEYFDLKSFWHQSLYTYGKIFPDAHLKKPTLVGKSDVN